MDRLKQHGYHTHQGWRAGRVTFKYKTEGVGALKFPEASRVFSLKIKKNFQKHAGEHFGSEPFDTYLKNIWNCRA